MTCIAGLLDFHGRQASALVERVLQFMPASHPHRERWNDGPVALGQRTVGASRHIDDEASDLKIVFDGRLDNREELRRTMRTRNIDATGYGDACLVRAAYQTWGEECTKHLLGDFAFAVWDPANRKLFCATDAMGPCPLFYVLTADFFTFASTDEALLSLPGVRGEPNEEMLAGFLWRPFRVDDPAAGWLRDVKVLAPGTSIAVGIDGSARIATHWEWRAAEDARYASDEEAREAFESVFAEAVRCRVADLQRPALMLSGGIDSASIRAALHDGMSTYSVIADDPAADIESQSIASLAQGANPTFVRIPSLTGPISREDIAREAWTSPQPCESALILPSMMCLAASRQGESAMLHGVSGDITTAFPQRYPAYLIRDGHLQRAYEECRAISRNSTFLEGASPARQFLLNAWTAAVPAPINRAAQQLRSDDLQAGIAASGVAPVFAERLELLAKTRARASAEHRRLPANPQHDQATLLRSRLGPALGTASFSRIGKRHGLEMRDPWADRRVVEFFLRLPLRFKARDGWSKYLVRTSVERTAGPKLAWRRDKEHLGGNLLDYAIEDGLGTLAKVIDEHLEPASSYLDVDAVRPRLVRFVDDRRHGRPMLEEERRLAYHVAVAGLWLERLKRLGASNSEKPRHAQDRYD